MDAAEFKGKQRNGWNSVSAGWEKWAHVFDEGASGVSKAMLAAARLGPGHRVLDIASGPGEPALTAAETVGNEGHVTLTDISSEMLAVARRRADKRGIKNVAFHECDAEVLDVPHGPYDAVTSRWGLMFLPQLGQCLDAVVKQLKPGARLAAAVWGPPPSAPSLSTPVMTLMKSIGIQPPPPGTPGIFGLANPEPLVSGLKALGFTEVEVGESSAYFAFDEIGDYIQFMQDVASPMNALIATQPEERRQALWDEVAEAVLALDGFGTLPNTSLIISATAPQ